MSNISHKLSLNDLNEIILCRQDTILLNKICNNILKHPHNKQYQNIHIERIRNKFIHPNLCLNILNNAGFCQSADGKRLLYKIEHLSELQHTCHQLLFIAESHSLFTDSIISSEYLLKSNNYSTAKRVLSDPSIECNVDNCLCIQVILNVLSLYKQYIAEVDVNDDIHDIIYNKIGNEYNNVDLLDDFNHILLYHSDDFEDIYNTLCAVIYDNKPCDLKQCVPLRRNQRDRFLMSQNEQLLSQIYFNDDNIAEQQLLDRIHCHFFHTFDIGYKLTYNERQSIVNNFECKLNDTNTDMTAMQINSLILNKQESRQNAKGLQRLNGKCTKFMSNDTTMDEYRFGYRFFYWDYYKNNNELTDSARRGVDSFMAIIGSNTDGMALKDWFVANKYDSFKDELLNNDICCIGESQWTALVIKASIHIDTDRVKQIKCIRTKTAECYSMYSGFEMQLNHLIALMLYCNFDQLQQKFSETFRKMDNNETIKSVKSRNQSYHHLAKLLRECVECFGMSSKMNVMNVYHGINKQFTFSSMSAYINTPFSTTLDYGVAVNFCGNEGMILQLQINIENFVMKRNEGVDAICTFLCFDCEWISDYSNEKEIFCIGGLSAFDFDTVMTPKGVNYCKYITAIRCITFHMSQEYGFVANTQNMVAFEHPSIELLQIMYRLLSHELYRYIPNHCHAHPFNSCPDYIKNVLHSHCFSIRNIWFCPISNKIHDLFFRDDIGWIKLPMITTIFPNVSHITVYAGNKDNIFINNEQIYNSILDIIAQNTSLIRISIGIDPFLTETAIEITKKYQNDFNKHGWGIIAINAKPDLLCKSFGMDFEWIRNDDCSDTVSKWLKQMNSKIYGDKFISLKHSIQSDTATIQMWNLNLSGMFS